MAEISVQVSNNINGLLQEFDIITHNLANVNTCGFKRRRNAFTAALEAQQSLSDDMPTGEINVEQSLDFSQGNLVHTGRSLDIALHGKGFFVIETTQGPQYTRNGVFHLNQNGQLVTSDGQVVAGNAGPITIPPTVQVSQLYINSEGEISAGNISLGRLQVVHFGDNESKLIPAGASTYGAPEDIPPEPLDTPVVQQGYQESSNVHMVDELVGLINVSRLYEANMKFITAQQEGSQMLMDVAAG